MKDPHTIQWENIKKRYESFPQTEEIKFRIECIDELLTQDKEKELNHFK